MNESEGFDREEITSVGQQNGRVRELSDPDAYVMLGKLATAVARCEKTLDEFAKEARQDRRTLRRMVKGGGAGVVGAAAVIQGLFELLRQMGVIK